METLFFFLLQAIVLEGSFSMIRIEVIIGVLLIIKVCLGVHIILFLIIMIVVYIGQTAIMDLISALSRISSEAHSIEKIKYNYKHL